MLTKVDVGEAVNTALEKRAERTGVTQDWIIERLVENVERSMPEDGDENTYQGSVANKALELLGRHHGLFTDRIEHTGNVAGPVTFIMNLEDKI